MRKLFVTSILFCSLMACHHEKATIPGQTIDSLLIGKWDCIYDSEVGPVSSDRQYIFQRDGKASRIVFFKGALLIDYYTWQVRNQTLVIFDTKNGWIDSMRIDNITAAKLEVTQYFLDPPTKQAFTKINIHN